MARGRAARVRARAETERTGVYSFEQREAAELPPEFERRFRAAKAAWKFFDVAPAVATGARPTHWVISAKRDETRQPAPPTADRLLGGGAGRAAAGAMSRRSLTLVR